MHVQLIPATLDRLARRMSIFTLLAALFILTAAPPTRAAASTLAPTASAASTAAAPSVDDGLVSYWPFDEGSGATSIDYGGSGNNVTIHSPAGFTNVTAPLDFASPAAFKSVINPSSYGTASGTNIDNLQTFTIAFWMRLNAVPQNDMTLVTLPNKASLLYDTHSFGKPIFFTIFPDTPFVISRGISLNGTQPGTYYHVVATYGSNGMRVFLNGQSVNDLPGYSPLKPGSGVTFSAPTTPFDGALDDVRIYDRVLSDTEIARLAFRCNSISEIPQAECHALADLYLNTNGASWTNHTGWLQTNTPCSWYGVLCIDGHVFLLGLPNNGLNGALPLSLNDLTGLTSLGLDGNQLNGPIPALLNGLINLKTFNLSHNQLSGGVPFQLGNLTNLQALDLSANALSGDIATSLTHLTKLTTLNVSYNALNPTDSTVRAFLTAYQPSWATSQTVPPMGIQAKAQSGSSVIFTWTPIAYTADGGYYEVLSIDPNTGLMTSRGKTADKTATGLTVSGLTVGQSYSFLVRTFTPKHGDQPNDVMSDPSDPITVMPANQTPATITIALDVQPDSATNFRFDGGLGTFFLDDITPSDRDAYSSSKTFSVAAGTYTMVESVPSGWINANISCNPPANTVADLSKNQITINAASGANITCTFVTQRSGQVIGGSYNDHNHNHTQDRNDEWLSGWAMQLRTDSTPLIANQATNQTGRASFTSLRPGSYTICETLRSGWFNITPGSNPPCYTVNVAPGTAVWTRFGNSITPLASIASAATLSDIIVCDLAPTDDLGNPMTEERDPWEEEEDATARLTIFLPVMRH